MTEDGQAPLEEGAESDQEPTQATAGAWNGLLDCEHLERDLEEEVPERLAAE